MLSTLSNFWADNGMTIIGYILSLAFGILIGNSSKGGDSNDRH